MSITGCILMKNEEELISGCIDSIKTIADEIIVVDNGSSDRSADIARNHGCFVIDSPDTLFDQSRNLYLDKVRTDWVFVLDADERLDSEKSNVALDAAKYADKDIVQYNLPVFNYMGLGKFVETQLAGRFYRSHPLIRYNNVPSHATISMSAKKIGRKENLYYPIHHIDALCKKRTSDKRKGNKRKEYLQNIIAQNPEIENLSTQYVFLGAEYAADHDYETALSLFTQSMMTDNVSINTAYIYSAQVNLIMGHYEKARYFAEKLIEKEALVDRAYCILAQIAVNENDREKAAAYCREALEKKPLSIAVMLNLASLIEDNDPNEAMDYLKRAVQLNPYLLNPMIYGNGDEPNMYSFQSPLLSTYKNFNVHMAKCCEMIGTI